ncbi:hypothetical protein J6590_034554 [Homalodisca vitripennis]|nr:hypothetical protein J6590_034554 [Homalodisca vitripennis]
MYAIGHDTRLEHAQIICTRSRCETCETNRVEKRNSGTILTVHLTGIVTLEAAAALLSERPECKSTLLSVSLSHRVTGDSDSFCSTPETRASPEVV